MAGDDFHVTSSAAQLKTFLIYQRLAWNPAEGILTMAEQQVTYWDGGAEVDEDLEDVDLNLAIGNFGQTDQYEDGMSGVQNHAFDNITKAI